MNERISEILTSSGYDKNVHETARKILKEVKLNFKNYGEVKKALNNISKYLIYENPERYGYLLTVIRNLLEEEINDLPLTNR